MYFCFTMKVSQEHTKIFTAFVKGKLHFIKMHFIILQTKGNRVSLIKIERIGTESSN